jgi:hypothetical protein
MSTKKTVNLYIFDFLILKTTTLLIKLFAVGGLVQIIIRHPGRDQGRSLSKNTGRVIIGIVSIYIRCKSNKGFVYLISYFLVICISTEIILGLVKTLKINN